MFKLQKFIDRKKTLILKKIQIMFLKNLKKRYVSYLCVIFPNEIFPLSLKKI
jgi:hypothetical protein